MSKAWLLAAVPVLGILLACGGGPSKKDLEHPMVSDLEHDAYVWQRRWTPALRHSVTAMAPQMRAYRVLAAQLDGDGTVHRVSPDIEALRHSGRPIVAVVRFDGTRDLDEVGDPLLQGLEVVSAWRRAGVPVSGLEVDYDCPRRRLGAFIEVLRRGRAQVQQQTPALSLSVTLLPDWLESERLPELLAQVDDAVLQVHSVLAPERGLFDPDLARSWLRRLSEATPGSFRVALPTYGHRVAFNTAGRPVAVESEARRGLAAMPSQELFARPRQLAGFVDGLRRDPVPGLKGVAWFRLPSADDRRVWQLDTWRAVMSGSLLQQTAWPRIVARPAAVKGTLDLHVVHPGAYDEELPLAFEVAADGPCRGDATRHYRLEVSNGTLRFVLQQPVLLRPGEQRVVGWIRCAGEKEVEIHVAES